FDFYDVAPANFPFRQFTTLQDGTTGFGTNGLVSMGLNNNQSTTDSGGNFYMARIVGYSPPTVDPEGGPNETGTLGSGAYFKLNDFGVGTRSLGWHNLKVIISTDDGVGTDYQFFVDNVLAERVNNVGGAGTTKSYDNVALGSGLTASSQAYFDNVSVQY